MPTLARRCPAILVALALAGPAPSPAQETAGTSPDSAGGASALGDAFLDTRARTLFLRARERWLELDREVASYEAEVRQRFGVFLRTPLKDRTIYRSESAARVFWSAEGGTVIQALGARATDPTGVRPPGELEGIVEEVFDPGGDRIYFGMVRDGDADEDVWIEHPLAPGSEASYRFRSGDTITVSLPGGRRLRAEELQIIPRERSVHLLTGALWIEPEEGALVRALYRVSRTIDVEEDTDAFDEDPELERLPGIFRPLELEVSLVTVEYSLWDLRHWLPRFMRIEGEARAGIVRAPGAAEISYRILDVRGAAGDDVGPVPTVDEVAAGWREGPGGAAYEEAHGERENDGRRIVTLVPVERERLHDPATLPPPIGDEAPGFSGAGELEDLYRSLADVPAPPAAAEELRPRVRWGPERPDLVRYNRVEGLSVGARARTAIPSPVGPLETGLTGRVGVPDLVPSVRLDVGWSSPLRSVDVALFREVAEVDERSRGLGPGNSATALLFGRDDGEYYRSAGASLTLAPPPAARRWYDVRLSAERHGALRAGTEFAVSDAISGADGSPFRPNVAAAEGWEHGAALTLRPWWGSDPRGGQGGVELLVHGATGDFEYLRTRLVARTAFPLAAGFRAALEAAGGTAMGEPPPQRLWYLGGARTLRGYGGSAAVGPTFLRARGELARTFGVVGAAAFADAGWAGERNALDPADALVSAGLGASLLDGLIRLDLARALRAPTGWRLEVYVDAVL